MSQAGDVTVIATMAIQNSANAAIIRAVEASGGFSTVADHTVRDAIPSNCATLGTLVRTLNDGVVWEVTSVGPVVWLPWSGGGSGGGGGSIVAEVYSPSLTAVVAATDLYPSSLLPAGLYVEKAYLTIKTAGSVGALVVNAHFTDDSGTAQIVPITAPLSIATAGVSASGEVPIQSSGSVTVKYSVSAAPGTFTAGSLVYSLRLVLELDRASTTPAISGTYVSSFNGRIGVVTPQVNDYGPSQLAQESATTGQIIYWNGTTWAEPASITVGSGFVSIGPAAALAGSLRLPTGANAIRSRNAANTSDLSVYQSDGSDGQSFGSTSGGVTTLNGNSQVAIALAGTSKIVFNGTSSGISYQTFAWNTGLAPVLNQATDATAGATGGLFTINAQDMSGTTSTGGKLLLRSGTGTTNAGNVEIQFGTTSALLFNGASANFNANNLVTTGAISLGTTPASAGAIRLPSGATVGPTATGIYSRNAANTGDIIVYRSNTSDDQQFGDTGTAGRTTLAAGSQVTLQISSTAGVTFSTTSAVIGVPTVSFNQAGTFNVSATTVTAATGAQLTVGAQDSNGTGATVGGKLVLTSGTGVSKGDINLNIGGTTQVTVNTNGIAVAGNVTAGGSSDQFIANSGTPNLRLGLVAGSGVGVSASSVGDIKLRYGAIVGGRNSLDTGNSQLLDWGSTTASILTIGSSGVGTTLVSSGDLTVNAGGAISAFKPSSVVLGVTTLAFSSGASSFFIADSTAAGATGSTLTIHAQNATGTGSTTGGALLIESGTGTTTGTLQLKGGATLSILDYGVTNAANITLGSTGTSAFIVSGSVGTFFQAGGSSACFITSTQLHLQSIATVGFDSAGTFSILAGSTASATGALLTVAGQDETGTTSTGGKLLIRSGTGTTAPGAFEIRAGATTLFDYAVTTAGTITIGIGGSALVLNHTSAGLGLSQGGAAYAGFTSTQAQFPTSYNIKLINGGSISCSTTGIASATGGPLNLIATDCTGTTSIGGEVLIRGGTGTTRNGNVHFHAHAANSQSMGSGIFIGNASSVPTGNPASGGFLYVNAGALTYRGSSGTVTVLGPA